MKSIRFETGYKTFSINDDPDRTISFNPTDADIVQRFAKAIKELQSEKETMADIQLNPEYFQFRCIRCSICRTISIFHCRKRS